VGVTICGERNVTGDCKKHDPLEKRTGVRTKVFQHDHVGEHEVRETLKTIGSESKSTYFDWPKWERPRCKNDRTRWAIHRRRQGAITHTGQR